MSTALQRHSILEQDILLIRRNFWTLVGAKFRIFGTDGGLLAVSRQKAFKLKEDIRVYADEELTHELLLIKARSVIDFSATYDVIDATTGEKAGAIRRKGVKSILKDAWLFLDAHDGELGTLEEDSMLLALVRRFLANIIPQKFTLTIGGQPVGSISQHFNPFIFKATMDLQDDRDRRLDRRLAMAALVLILAIEGRQQ